MNIFLFITITSYFTYSFKTHFFDNAIGNWKLLYSDNILLDNNKDKCCLTIFPINDSINEILSVKIKRLEKNSIFTQTKLINCNVYNTGCDEITGMCLDELEGKICTLLILNTEKYIKSIGIFEFPFLAVKYKSGLNPQYNLIWNVDNITNRLYIYFNDNTYVFERYMKDDYLMNEQMITTNTFLLTNLISFFIGKFLEKTIHLQ